MSNAILWVTEREMQVWLCIARGESRKQLGASLGLARTTVDKHAENLYRKIGAKNSVDATLRAIQFALITATPAAELPELRIGRTPAVCGLTMPAMKRGPKSVTPI